MHFADHVISEELVSVMSLARQLNPNAPVLTGRKARRKLERMKRKQGNGSQTVQDDATAAADALWRKGDQEIKAGRYGAALKTFGRIAEMVPERGMAHYVIGHLFELTATARDAFPHLMKAAELEPSNPKFLRALGHCLGRMSLFDAAAEAYRKALEADPYNPDLHIFRGRAQFGAGDSAAAMASFKAALAIEPDHVTANFELGHQYEVQGEFGLARECYTKVLEIEPEKFEVHLRLASMGDAPSEEQANIVERLDEVLASEELTDVQRKQYLYTGGKIHQRLKNYDKSFEQYVAANAIEAKEHPFDRDMYLEWFNAQVNSFTPEVFAHHDGAGDDTEQPVFIVGMPRSGTTLTEQIISSHPLVAGAGELGKLDQMLSMMQGTRNADLSYPRDVSLIGRDAIANLSGDYLKVLRAQGREDAVRITDKYVFNFYHLGMIAILFPRARIIHCKRDPLDTGISCLFQNFSSKSNFPFWHRLEDIGFYYRHYLKLMEHWHAVLPVEIMDVQYEEMVADQEAMSRKLIDFVGLDWDDACLRFYENRRAVATASVWQVRQKVYTSSVQRWRAYDKHLDPLRRALAGEEA